MNFFISYHRIKERRVIKKLRSIKTTLHNTHNICSSSSLLSRGMLTKFWVAIKSFEYFKEGLRQWDIWEGNLWERGSRQIFQQGKRRGSSCVWGVFKGRSVCLWSSTWLSNRQDLDENLFFWESTWVRSFRNGISKNRWG